ncbi:MAG: VanZ family protein [Bacteroidota bacterium]
MSRRTGLAVAWSALILAACSIPGDAFGEYESILFSFDKLGHLVLFLVFAVLWARAVPGRLGAIALGGVAFAFGSEAWQTLLPFDRAGDLLDVLADVVGLGIGLVWAYAVERRSASEASNVRTGGVS